MREEIEKKYNNNKGAFIWSLSKEKGKVYLDYINEHIPDFILDKSISEKLYYFFNNLTEPFLCDCGKPRLFYNSKKGYYLTCGDLECMQKSRVKTNNVVYGCDNPKQNKDVQKKSTDTIKNKYGEDAYKKGGAIRKKFNSTMKERYDVEWSMQSKELLDKSLETWKNNPNKEEIAQKKVDKHNAKSDEEKQMIIDKRLSTYADEYGSVDNFYEHVRDKSKETCKDKYGVEHHMSHPDFIKKRVDSFMDTITEKIKNRLPENIEYISRRSNDYNIKNNSCSIIKLKCLDCGEDFEINTQYLTFRINNNKNPCLICNPVLHGKSGLELEVLDFVKNNYDKEVLSNKKTIISKELDIYLPNDNLAFEFNGLYWHSEEYKDNNFHKNKTDECKSIGINLMHIWEDDWLYKQDIVKSIIINKLGKSNRIYARKCEIREITDNNIIKDFLNENHLQGFVGSKIKLGLFYENKLVSLMTFGELRKSLGQNRKEGTFELLRFCNILNTTIIGGASKLFKYFLNKYDPNQVISYSDNSRSVGGLYVNLGFQYEHDTKPTYYYIIDDIRRHRFNYRKDILIKGGADPNKTEVEIMHERGIYRIFDCGAKKWIYNK